MNVGDVWWVDLPVRAGHAQSGRRPAVVVQTSDASDRLPTTLVIPLTTQQDALRFPATVLVEPSAENGLRRASVALVFQLSVIDQRFLDERMGVVSETVLTDIWTALDELTGRTTDRPENGERQ